MKCGTCVYSCQLLLSYYCPTPVIRFSQWLLQHSIVTTVPLLVLPNVSGYYTTVVTTLQPWLLVLLVVTITKQLLLYNSGYDPVNGYLLVVTMPQVYYFPTLVIGSVSGYYTTAVTTVQLRLLFCQWLLFHSIVTTVPLRLLFCQWLLYHSTVTILPLWLLVL